jgi:hypothetical protein
MDPKELAKLKKRIRRMQDARMRREARRSVWVPVNYDEVNAISEMINAAAKDPNEWAGCEPDRDS